LTSLTKLDLRNNKSADLDSHSFGLNL